MRLVPHSAVAALLLACQPPTLTSQVAVSGSWRTVTWPPRSSTRNAWMSAASTQGAQLDPDLAGAQVGRLDAPGRPHCACSGPGPRYRRQGGVQLVPHIAGQVVVGGDPGLGFGVVVGEVAEGGGHLGVVDGQQPGDGGQVEVAVLVQAQRDRVGGIAGPLRAPGAAVDPLLEDGRLGGGAGVVVVDLKGEHGDVVRVVPEPAHRRPPPDPGGQAGVLVRLAFDEGAAVQRPVGGDIVVVAPVEPIPQRRQGLVGGVGVGLAIQQGQGGVAQPDEGGQLGAGTGHRGQPTADDLVGDAVDQVEGAVLAPGPVGQHHPDGMAVGSGGGV